MGLASAPRPADFRGMNLPEPEQDFLRELVKTSRQRAQHVRWTDRDGTARVTTMTETDSARLNGLAKQLGLSREALLQQASHLPAIRRPSPPTPI